MGNLYTQTRAGIWAILIGATIGLLILFVGAKLLLVDLIHIPALLSLAIVGLLLLGSVLLSIVVPKKDSEEAKATADPPEETKKP